MSTDNRHTGYTGKALLIAARDLSYIAAPGADGITIDDTHLLEAGKEYIECYCLPQSVQSASASFAEAGALQQLHRPQLFVPGESPELFDLLESLLNEPMILLLHDPYLPGGYLLQFGGRDMHLYFEKQDFMSASRYEGMKGWQVNCWSPVRFFLNPEPTLLQQLTSRLAYLGLSVSELSTAVYDEQHSVIKSKSSLLMACIGHGTGYALAIDSNRWPVQIPFSRNSTATRINASGVPETIAANVPRLGYDASTLAVKGYLIEPAATNYVTRSETALAGSNTAAWGSYSISGATLSVEVATHGFAKVYRLAENTNNGAHTIFSGNGGLSGTGARHILSCEVKANGRTKLQFNNGSTVNLATGSSSNTALTTITALPNGWYRIAAILKTNGSMPSWTVQLLNGSDAASYTGDGTSGVYMRMAQVEATAAATSYIPTSGSSATRAADIFSYDDAQADGYLPDGSGTAYVQFSELRGITSALSAGIAYVPEATHTNLNTATMLHEYSSNDISGTAMKLGNQYNSTTLKEYVNGTVRYDISYTTSTGLTGFYLKADAMPMYLRALALFYTPLLNAELMQITT